MLGQDIENNALYLLTSIGIRLAPIAGFILSAQTRQLSDGISHVFWLATDNGPVKAQAVAESAVFFVAQSQQQRVIKLLQAANLPCDIRTVTLHSFAGKPMAGCYFTHLNQFYAAREQLKEQGITLYEDDIRAHERFLMERFIRGGVWVDGTSSANGSLVQARFKSHPHYRPTLRVLSLDIECSGDGVLYSVGLVSERFQRVLMVGRSTEERSWLEYVEDEAALLVRLQEHIHHIDPDVIVGWNVIDFDFQLLCYRAQQLGIRLNLGRNNEAVVWRGGKVAKLIVPGRAVLDGIDMLKNATYYYPSFALDNVAHEILGERKLIENKDKVSEISRLFNEDKLQLAEYNLKDCELVLAIFARLELVDFAIVRTQLTGLPLERLGGSVAAFTNLYLPLLHRSGYVAPNLGDHGLTFDSPGGYVMDSVPGLYQNVAVLDFKSLYPSIIRTFCIDPMGLIEGFNAPDDAIAGYHEAFFSRSKHHLPDLVASLAQARQEAKKHRDPHLQQAIKIIMNSLYGVLGSKGCRFYDPRLASSITLRGHDIMQTTRQWLIEYGVDVIYGDTDSTFIALPEELSDEQSHTLAKELVTKINNRWRQTLEQSYGIPSYLELEYESLYRPFFMPKARHKDVGTKKRYTGLLVQKHRELVFKGMESVRSDWTPLARKFQGELFQGLFTGANLQHIIDNYVNTLQKGDNAQLLTYAKRLGKNPDEYTKATPPHVKAARNSTQSYAKGDWVEYVITVDGPRCTPSSRPLDLAHYLEKQLKPIIDDIADVCDVSLHCPLDSQFTLI